MNNCPDGCTENEVCTVCQEFEYVWINEENNQIDRDDQREFEKLNQVDTIFRYRLVLASSSKNHELLRNLYSLDNKLINREIAKNSYTPEDLIAVIFKDADLRKYLAQNLNLDKEMYAYLAKYKAVKKFLSSNISVPSDILESLIKDANEELKIIIAQNPNLNELVIRQFANQYGNIESFGIAIFSNKNTPTDILNNLFDKHEGSICYFLTKYLLQLPDNCPEELLNKLVILESKRDQHSIIRNERCEIGLRTLVASFEKSPNKILEKLYAIELPLDGHQWIRDGLARNKNLPSNILEKLIHDNYKSVRQQIAVHQVKLTKNFIETLVNDKSESVRIAAFSNPSLSLEYLEKEVNSADFELRNAIVRNPATPQHVLLHLMNDENRIIRRNVAAHANATELILKNLVLDDEQYVREAVASNPNVSIEQINILLTFNNFEINSNLLINPNSTREQIRQIINL